MENIVCQALATMIREDKKTISQNELTSILQVFQNQIKLGDLISQDGMNLLHHVVLADRITLVKSLYETSCWDVMVRGRVDNKRSLFKGLTPSLLARDRGHWHILGEIQRTHELEKSLKPLHRAIRDKQLQKVEELIQTDPKAVLEVSSDGTKPSHWACLTGSLEVLQLLWNQGADFQLVNSQQESGLLVAVNYCKSKIIPYLIDECKIDPNQASRNDVLPIDACARMGDWKGFQILLEKGAGLRSTVLIHAATSRKFRFMNQLLESKRDLLDIEVSDFEGMTPLLIAVSQGNLHMVELLIFHGALLTATDNEHQTVLHLAVKGKHFEMLRFLLQTAVKLGTQCLHSLLNARSSFQTLHSTFMVKGELSNRIPVWTLLEANRSTLYTFLHTEGSIADVNEFGKVQESGIGNAPSSTIPSPNPNTLPVKPDLTPLHLAIMVDHRLMAELLINYGEDLNQSDAYGFTPLHLCSMMGNLTTVKYLIQCGANPFSLDNAKRSPTQIAQLNGHLHIVRFLLSLQQKHERTAQVIPLWSNNWMGKRQFPNMMLRSAGNKSMILESKIAETKNRENVQGKEKKCHIIENPLSMETHFEYESNKVISSAASLYDRLEENQETVVPPCEETTQLNKTFDDCNAASVMSNEEDNSKSDTQSLEDAVENLQQLTDTLNFSKKRAVKEDLSYQKSNEETDNEIGKTMSSLHVMDSGFESENSFSSDRARWSFISNLSDQHDKISITEEEEKTMNYTAEKNQDVVDVEKMITPQAATHQLSMISLQTSSDDENCQQILTHSTKEQNESFEITETTVTSSEITADPSQQISPVTTEGASGGLDSEDNVDIVIENAKETRRSSGDGAEAQDQLCIKHGRDIKIQTEELEYNETEKWNYGLVTFASKNCQTSFSSLIFEDSVDINLKHDVSVQAGDEDFVDINLKHDVSVQAGDQAQVQVNQDDSEYAGSAEKKSIEEETNNTAQVNMAASAEISADLEKLEDYESQLREYEDKVLKLSIELSQERDKVARLKKEKRGLKDIYETQRLNDLAAVKTDYERKIDILEEALFGSKANETYWTLS